MSTFDKVKEKLISLGAPLEVASNLAKNIVEDTSGPAVNSHAEGGKGGTAINLTYVDNYSTLMLVYTFLLNSLDNDQENTVLNQSLLTTLQTVMHEQQQYRDAFLQAIQNLNKQ